MCMEIVEIGVVVCTMLRCDISMYILDLASDIAAQIAPFNRGAVVLGTNKLGLFSTRITEGQWSASVVSRQLDLHDRCPSTYFRISSSILLGGVLC